MQAGLRRLQRARSEDERALLAACVYADLEALGASSDHRINLLAYALPKEVRTTYNVLAAGRALVADAVRHAISAQSPTDVQSLSRAAKTVRPNMRRACKRSLFDAKAPMEAISRLSPRDQTLVAREIERRVMLADAEAREDIDGKAGLHKLACSTLDDLDFAGRNDSITRRQLAKRSPVERRFIVREMVSNELDEMTGTPEALPSEGSVRQYVAAFRDFAKRYRAADARQTTRAKRNAALVGAEDAAR